MSKSEQIVEHIAVTFFEAGIAYLAINQTSLHGNPKVAAIGALGAGLSAVYNLLRQSTPTFPSPADTASPLSLSTPVVVSPDPGQGSATNLQSTPPEVTPPVDTPPSSLAE